MRIKIYGKRLTSSTEYTPEELPYRVEHWWKNGNEGYGGLSFFSFAKITAHVMREEESYIGDDYFPVCKGNCTL